MVERDDNETNSMNENGHEYVDLRLPSGTLWAKDNLIMDKDRYGLYGSRVMWGQVKSNDSLIYIKDFERIPDNIQGKTHYDVATNLWGDKWMVPSTRHFEELEQFCTKTVAINGTIKGWKFIGPNGNSIFLPSLGIKILDEDQKFNQNVCAYWTSNKVKDTLSSNAFVIPNRDPYNSNKGTGLSYITPLPVECKILVRPIIPGGNDFKNYYQTDAVVYNPIHNPELSEPTGEIDGHPYVDLGLESNRKWAYSNVGAIKPWDLGELFHWGAIKGHPAESILGEYKIDRDEEEVYKIKQMLFQVGLNSMVNVEGIDAATSHMGHNWHIPEQKDFEELIGSCIWTPAVIGHIQGFKVVGPNGNSIFIPFNMTGITGGKFGLYMSSKLEYHLVLDNIKEYILKLGWKDDILGIRAVSD